MCPPSPIVATATESTARSIARTTAPWGLVVTMGQGGRIRWTPEGRGIAYVRQQPQPNLWVQPLDGGSPRQLTEFTDGREILDFAWSHDGRRLAIARATTATDIVLFKGLQTTSR